MYFALFQNALHSTKFQLNLVNILENSSIFGNLLFILCNIEYTERIRTVLYTQFCVQDRKLSLNDGENADLLYLIVPVSLLTCND